MQRYPQWVSCHNPLVSLSQNLVKISLFRRKYERDYPQSWRVVFPPQDLQERYWRASGLDG